MAIVKVGSFSVVAGGAAQNLNLGFIPSYFMMWNTTNVTTQANDELIKAEWFQGMADASAILTNYTGVAPAIEINPLATNGFTPIQTSDALLYVPNQAPYTTTTRVPSGASTNLVITGISKAVNASITATHSFTAADVGVTVVTINHVVGMTEINTLRGVIQSVNSTTDFTVNINSSNFATYASGGIANVITGAPATTLYSNTSLPTSQANLGFIGLTMGTSLMTTTADVWRYVAQLDAPFNG